MSTSTKEAVKSETQQTQEAKQKAAAENNEAPKTNASESNQETGFNFEKSKAKLEFISIAIALVGLISTGLVKVLSLGRYLCFYFDINNCEFKLTNTDFIVLFLSLFCCGSAILYCYITNGWRIGINAKVNECFDSQTKAIIKVLKVLGFGFLYFLIILFYILLGSLIIFIITNAFNALEPLRNDLIAMLGYTCTFVVSLSCLTLKEDRKLKKFYITICAVFFLLTGFLFIKTKYDDAVNQKGFEIITIENHNEVQTYAVISRGSSYSAYQCIIDNDNGILTINTDLHRYFPLDDTETRLYDFEEYRLVEYK